MAKLTNKQQRFVDEYLVDIERFERYIDKSNGPESCWNWMGAKDSNGYGRFHIGLSRNASMLAHRIAYGITMGEKPEAVCHKCDNPSCCNPKHLFGGTREDNNKDMTRKRRHWAHVDRSRALKGESHGGAKLNEQQIHEIRRKYAAGFLTQRAIAKEYGVCQRTINKIVNKTGWSHV